MRVDDFDFDLPEELIALRPAVPREAARLLVVRPGEGLADRTVGDLASLLQPGDAVVFNDTRVIPAELTGTRFRGEERLAFRANLHKRAGPDAWWAFARPGKRLKVGDRLRFGDDGASNVCMLGQLDGTIVEKGEGGDLLIRFELSGAALDEAISAIGETPLPPYIAARRAIDAQDRRDYQTIYARIEGSVAAPTAGLHVTPPLLEALETRGVSLHFVTLHVGAGTFLPVKVDDTDDHRMHAETGEISAETAAALNAVRARGGKIVSIGTTSLRLLESAADADGILHPFSGDTSIFITPGYRFRAVDRLFTNFHLPRSTLFMLVSAFSGLDTMRAAYAHAVRERYRFYSYGDASLLFPRERA